MRRRGQYSDRINGVQAAAHQATVLSLVGPGCFRSSAPVARWVGCGFRSLAVHLVWRGLSYLHTHMCHTVSAPLTRPRSSKSAVRSAPGSRRGLNHLF